MIPALILYALCLCLEYGHASLHTGVSAQIKSPILDGPTISDLISKSTLARRGNPIRKLDNTGDYTFLSGYSIKFVGCHHVQQLDYDNGENGEITLYTKRLIRFRLVPYDQCERIPGWAKYGDAVSKFLQDARGYAGIFDDYGEYIVDINTFLSAYIGAVQDQNYQLCAKFQSFCADNCQHYYGDSTAYQNCLRSCFSTKGATNCFQDAASAQSSYAYCSQFNWDNDNNNNNNKNNNNNNNKNNNNNNKQKYYLGPRCSIQGGEIEMALFTDNTCTSLLKCSSGSGARCYTEKTGITLPYTLTNIIENTCIPCTENYANLMYSLTLTGESNSPSDFDFGYPRSYCTNLYNMAGKCETHMTQSNVQNACSYIAGLTIGVSDEGVAKARKVKRRIGPDLAITFLVIGIVFSSMYLLYLKNLLSKPKLSKSENGYVVRTGAWA
jgi:hypothetical protein